MDGITRDYCADQLSAAIAHVRAGALGAAQEAIAGALNGLQDAQTQEPCTVCRGYDDDCPVCQGSGRVLWTVEEILSREG